MTYKKIFKSIYRLIENSLKRQLVFFVGLSILAVLFEVLSLASLYPFLSALMGQENSFITTHFNKLGLSSPQTVDLAMTFSFLIIVGFIVRVYVLRLGLKLSAQIGTELSYKLVESLLKSSFENFSGKQSGEFIAIATTKVNSLVFGIITPFLNLVVSALIIIGVMTALLSVNVLVTSSVLGFVVFCYLIVSLFVRKRVKLISKEVARDQSEAVLKLQEIFGAIREIILASVQDRFVNEYKAIDSRMRLNSSSSQFIASSPRYFIELVILLSVVIISTIFINTENDFNKILPVAGVYILALQKLLPLVQQVFSALTTIKSNHIAASEVLESMRFDRMAVLNLKATNKKEIPDDLITISLESCSFKYENSSSETLKECSIEISSGEHIGLVGRTGSGKSTIVDMLASLIDPANGKVILNGVDISELDKKEYRKLFAFVPQNIFLKDGTVLENILFPNSSNELSESRLNEVLRQSHLIEFLKSAEQGLNYRVGENGKLLSGGQRQRIAIARALYSGARFLILDEATSALDKETESSVYSAIASLTNIGIISIAHKESVLDSCKRIYSLEEGIVKVVDNI